MGIENLLSYNAPVALNDATLDIYGLPCTIYIPDNMVLMGWENTDPYIASLFGIPDITTRFTRMVSKIFINFTPKKKVFYHYNWFPEDADELVTAILPSACGVREGAFIRSAVPGQKSIWGDVVYTVVHIEDDGMYSTLNRTYFMRGVNSAELQELFSRIDVLSSGEVQSA